MVAIIVELALSHTQLDAVGVKPSSNRLIEERCVFFSTFEKSFLLVDPRNAAHRLTSYLRDFRIQLEYPPATHSRFVDGFRSQLNALASTVFPAIEVFSLRALSLMATLPIIAICCIVVGLDGFVRREVRKAGAGIESARIYHLAKRSIKPLCVWVSLVYLTLPITLDIRWAYGILVVTIPVLVGISISRFKKYV
ncbi:MAG: DUF4400 domain-containing protein [Gammaproteobacteria bacterium]|nr:DUF4400 domain-containing protein [Gammaproteobacteria bacterium]